eukprot:scpid2188/ scgid24485/ 
MRASGRGILPPPFFIQVAVLVSDPGSTWKGLSGRGSMLLRAAGLRHHWSLTTFSILLIATITQCCGARDLDHTLVRRDDGVKDPRQQEALIHAETNLLQLVDSVLPRNLQSRVRLHKHSRRERGQQRHKRGSSGRDQPKGKAEHPLPKRTSRGYLDHPSLRPKVRFVIQNAFPSMDVLNVTLTGAGTTGGVREERIPYGQSRETLCGLGLEDVLTVSSGKERFSQTVRDKILHIPDNAEVFIVPDQTRGRTLHSSITIYDLDVTFSVRHSWLMVYNALLSNNRDKPLRGVDVMLFDASKYRKEYSLHRIARNISLHKGQEALLPEGSYELKVIPHGMAADVYQFKKVESLLPPIFIKLLGGKRHFVTIQGHIGSAQFPPRLMSIPHIPDAKPPTEPKTPLIALNAYSEHEVTRIMFPKHNITIDLPSRTGIEETVYMKQGDIFNITSSTGHRHGFVINTAVPYRGGECAMIPDRSRTGQLEVFFGCWYRYAQPLPPSQFWIFVYHALLGYDRPVDWIIFDETALDDDRRHALFSLADGLYLTQGVASRMDLGNYSLKVVPHGSVYDAESFRRAESLIEPTYIMPQQATRYYAVIQGDYSRGPGVATVYPPMPIRLRQDDGDKGGHTNGTHHSSATPASYPSHVLLLGFVILHMLIIRSTL